MKQKIKNPTFVKLLTKYDSKQKYKAGIKFFDDIFRVCTDSRDYKDLYVCISYLGKKYIDPDFKVFD